MEWCEGFVHFYPTASIPLSETCGAKLSNRSKHNTQYTNNETWTWTSRNTFFLSWQRMTILLSQTKSLKQKQSDDDNKRQFEWMMDMVDGASLKFKDEWMNECCFSNATCEIWQRLTTTSLLSALLALQTPLIMTILSRMIARKRSFLFQFNHIYISICGFISDSCFISWIQVSSSQDIRIKEKWEGLRWWRHQHQTRNG